MMSGNFDVALSIFEQAFPKFMKEEVLSQELSNSSEGDVIVYTDLLRLNGKDKKADRFSEKLCAYYQNIIETDPELRDHRRNEMTLDCYYASDQKENFLRELEDIYFVKNDRRDWFTNMKFGDYLSFEGDPEYQKLFKRIEAEVHKQREEVIKFLKEEGDWNEAWDIELGLE